MKVGTRDVAKLTGMVALLAIFFDAAVGHGMTWENDPYWTYWITQTFLAATVFGLGTAWLGVGEGRGALMAAVHTAALTAASWSLLPVGTPSQPVWLDLEHALVTGIPIHFAVTYLGYLSGLWLWRRRAVGVVQPASSARMGCAAVVASVAVVALAGGAAGLALGESPGATWFLVRLLLTVPFLVGWWALAGRDRIAALAGAGVLALVWATYGRYLGPVGLPDTPLRIGERAAPGATVRWLDYRELWITSLPLYFAAMAIVLLADSFVATGRARARRPLAAAAAFAGVLALTGAIAPPDRHGIRASLEASGPLQIETGDRFRGRFVTGTGELSVDAVDQGGRATPLPPHDRLVVEATVEGPGGPFRITGTRATVEDPLGRFTTWWGVGFDVEHHGRSGIGTSALPEVESGLAAFGLADVTVAGRVVATNVPLHVMTLDRVGGRPLGGIELDVGDPALSPVPGLPGGGLRVLWPQYSGAVPTGAAAARYLGGSFVIGAMLLLAYALARREAALLTSLSAPR